MFPLSYRLTSQCREKKRGPEEPEEMPETKKPRLADEESKPSATEPAEVQEAAPAVKSEQDSEVAETPKAAPTAEPKAETPEGNGGGSFKENPYTFLSPEDPILKACMYVSCSYVLLQAIDCPNFS